MHERHKNVNSRPCGILKQFHASALGFSNSVVIMIAALFIVGEGVFQTGLAQRAGDALVQWSGKSEFRMTMFMILLVAVLSAFLSNAGTVAILLPVVVILCRSMQLHPGKLLMPMAIASSMGGTLSPIGTAPNLLARQSLLNYGYEVLSFFAFTPIGIIILVAGGVHTSGSWGDGGWTSCRKMNWEAAHLMRPTCWNSTR